MAEAGVSASHQNKPNVAPGTGFRRVPFLLSRTRGLESSESRVQDITVLKNKLWYQRACIFLLCGGNILECNKKEREAGLSTPEMDVTCRNMDYLQQLCLAAIPQEMDVLVQGKEEVCCQESGPPLWYLSPQEWCEETGTKQNLCLWADLPSTNHESWVPFTCSGALPVLLQRDRASARARCTHDSWPGYDRADGQAVMGLMARLLWG